MASMKGAIALIAPTWESYMIAITWMQTGYLHLVDCFAIGMTTLYRVLALGRRVDGLRAGRSTRGKAARD